MRITTYNNSCVLIRYDTGINYERACGRLYKTETSYRNTDNVSIGRIQSNTSDS